MRPARCYMDSRATKYPAHGDVVAIVIWSLLARIPVCKSCLDLMLDACDAADNEPAGLLWSQDVRLDYCMAHGWAFELCADWFHLGTPVRRGTR